MIEDFSYIRSERSAIREHDAGLSRSEADTLAMIDAVIIAIKLATTRQRLLDISARIKQDQAAGEPYTAHAEFADVRQAWSRQTAAISSL